MTVLVGVYVGEGVCVIICCFSFNRFDLIFLMLDPQDEQFDHRLATHLVSLYHQSKEDEEGAYLVRDYL